MAAAAVSATAKRTQFFPLYIFCVYVCTHFFLFIIIITGSSAVCEKLWWKVLFFRFYPPCANFEWWGCVLVQWRLRQKNFRPAFQHSHNFYSNKTKRKKHNAFTHARDGWAIESEQASERASQKNVSDEGKYQYQKGEKKKTYTNVDDDDDDDEKEKHTEKNRQMKIPKLKWDGASGKLSIVNVCTITVAVYCMNAIQRKCSAQKSEKSAMHTIYIDRFNSLSLCLSVCLSERVCVCVIANVYCEYI